MTSQSPVSAILNNIFTIGNSITDIFIRMMPSTKSIIDSNLNEKLKIVKI